ncbi:unnamed protein product [Adineta ricciae]|uniref:Uncharacterized protein n=1 Tax=Adineta ricciae TaxID=249248 RepID=A0A815P494_ADIRI|nr:unnamed protein product [Adineta ricciae]
MFLQLIFLLVISGHVSWCVVYDTSNVAPGTKMSVNDDMFVSASNSFSNFAVLMHPFRNASAGGAVRCNMRWNTTDRFVHSVAVVGIAKNSTVNNTQFMFVFAAERISTVTPYVCIGIISESCASRSLCSDLAGNNSHQEYFLLGVDSNGTYAYGFTSTFVFKLNIYANVLVLNTTTDSIWPAQGFIPHSMDVASDWAVVAGYGYTIEYKKDYAALGCFVNLTTFAPASCVQITTETTFLIPADVTTYNSAYELSVAIRGNKIVVGVQRLATVAVLYRIGAVLNVSRINVLSFIDSTSVGRVVDWADDTTLAILVQDPYDTVWSQTEIFFYNENSISLTSAIFSFPNNQQILGSRLSQPSFARFSITISGNMAILTSGADILIIPNAPPGYSSRWIDTNDRVYVFYYVPKLCIGGTYKNMTSVGPCQICPPNTRNSGLLPYGITQCIPCSNNSQTGFCPLASLADIDPNSIVSYSQAVAYPESADTTDIEDLLIKNVFQISTEPHCLIISPLLWTVVVSGVCVLFLLFMLITHLCGCKSCIECGKKARNLFKHTDIIGEGEMWIGGLATFAIIVLVSFSYWFSASFIRRYPIEAINGPAYFACDESLVNAQFSTGLELLAIPKSEEAQPMFTLLDQQAFNLTVELINTGFSCDSITTQENLVSSKYVPLPMDCRQSIENATTYVTVPLPKHQTTVQVNISGPYWIGAFRLCFRGRGRTNSNYVLREMNFCELYGTPNEAIGRAISVPIVFIKNINMTQALEPADSTEYSGLWMPTFSTVSLSDEDYYTDFGNYLRYTSSLTVIQVALDERPFYMKNIQQPIVRTAELTFHGLLFTSLCIELFAFAFLIIKLFIVPLLRWFVFLWKKFRRDCLHCKDSNESLEGSLSTAALSQKIAEWRAKNNKQHDSLQPSSYGFNTMLESDQHSPATSQHELDSIHTISKL